MLCKERSAEEERGVVLHCGSRGSRVDASIRERASRIETKISLKSADGELVLVQGTVNNCHGSWYTVGQGRNKNRLCDQRMYNLNKQVCYGKRSGDIFINVGRHIYRRHIYQCSIACNQEWSLMEKDQERSEHKGGWKLLDLIYEQQLHHEGRDSREVYQGIHVRKQEHRVCHMWTVATRRF